MIRQLLRSRFFSAIQRAEDAWNVLRGRAQVTRSPGYWYPRGNTQFPVAIADDGLPCFRRIGGSWTITK